MLTDANPQFPRLKHNRPLDTQQLIRFIQGRSGLTAGDVVGMMYELSDTVLFFMREGTPVRLEGLGIFSPSLKLDGSIRVNFRADKSLTAELNRQNTLKHTATHRQNIGKRLTDLTADEVRQE